MTSTMMIPVMLSFTNIIFRDRAFYPYFPLLIKLVLCSAFVHQVSFLAFSSMPFAVGQVQDAGLVFLSTMATNVAASMDGNPDMISTVLYLLASSTVLLGILFYFVGRLQWANAVQYFPMPVLGAFLAYIGFFSGQAGFSFMAGQDVPDVYSWWKFGNETAIMLILPGMVGGILMYLCLVRIQRPYVLQVCVITIIVVFYVCLLVTETSLEDARAAGWIMPYVENGKFHSALWQL